MGHWFETHRELIERAQRIADGATDEHSAGFDGRLLEALDDYMKDVGRHDTTATHFMGVALSLIGRTPFDDNHRFIEPLVHVLGHSELHQEVVDGASAAMRSIIRRGSESASELTPKDAARLATLERVHAKTRAFLLARAPTSAWAAFDELVGDARLTVEEVLDLHALVLARAVDDEQERFPALEALYTQSSWLGRRILLSKLCEEHTAQLPVLVKIAPAVDPTTRTAAIEAMGRMGHVAAEPYLIHVLEEQLEGASMIAAASALGSFGTLASLPALRAAEQFDASQPATNESVQRAAADATAQLLERFPMEAAQGGLTLAEEHAVAGALTLAGASEGDISLYEAMQARVASVDSTQLVKSGEGGALMVPPDEAFQRLVQGPRDVPTTHYLEAYAWGRGAGVLIWGLATWLVFLAFSIEGGGAIAFIGHLIILVAGSLGIGHRTKDTRRVLREGKPTYGQLEDIRTIPEHPQKNESVQQYIYTFKYMTEDQRIETAERTYAARRHKIEDEPFEPLIYHDGDIVLFDEFTNLQVAEDGQLTTSVAKNIGFLVMPFVYLLMLIAFIVQNIGFLL